MKRIGSLISLLFLSSSLVWAKSPSAPPTCTLTATPNIVALGQNLTLNVMTQGEVSDVTVNGTPVNFPNAVVSVTPTQAGVFTASATATGPSGTGTCLATYAVTDITPVWLANPLVLPDACKSIAYQFSLGNSVNSPSGSPLTFSIGGNFPRWLRLSPDGTLSGTPVEADIGEYNFSVRATTFSAARADDEVVLRVRDCNNGISTFHLDASAGHPQAFYLPGITRRQGTYVLISGPTWMRLSSQGVLSGTPQASDAGTSQATVAVRQTISPPPGSGVTPPPVENFTFVIAVQP